MVKIRLTRMGNKKRAFYRIVVMDSESRRDGKAIEHMGYYNPMENPAEIKINVEKIEEWLSKGALMTPTVASLLKKAKTQ
ncbi:MAG: 30S ribosomal protein S16 [Desulfovibrionaceae bacterium]